MNINPAVCHYILLFPYLMDNCLGPLLLYLDYFYQAMPSLLNWLLCAWRSFHWTVAEKILVGRDLTSSNRKRKTNIQEGLFVCYDVTYQIKIAS